MGEAPLGKTLERLDNNKGYCKDNCSWQSMKTQARNKRTNYLVSYKNETKCIAEWAEQYQLTYACLAWRLKHGWSIEEALNTPSGSKR